MASKTNTPLIDAVTNGNIDEIRRCAFGNVNTEVRYGKRPLQVAIELKKKNIVQLLLAYGADISLCIPATSKIIPPKFIEDKEIAKLLFKNTDCYRDSPLALFAKMGNKNIVQQILADFKVDVNRVSKNTGSNALAAAAQSDSENLELIQFLVEEGACVNPSNAELPLISAIRTDKINVVQYLISVGANVNKLYRNKNIPLSEAVKKQNLAIIHYLLEHGAHYSIHFVFLDVIATQNLEIVDIFIEKGVQINLKHKNGITPLLKAVEIENLTIVEKLLENKADVNVEDSNGTTPLLKAIEVQNSAIVEKLLHNKADVNCGNPLIKASKLKNMDIILLLLEYGANTNSTDENGNTSFKVLLNSNVAGGKKNIAVVKRFLELGADIETTCDDGYSLLTKFIRRDESEMVKYLIDKGANPNQADQNGKTPLEIAAVNLNFEIFEYLIEHGGNMEQIKQQLDEIANKNSNIFGLYLESIRNVKRPLKKEDQDLKAQEEA